MRVFGWLLDVLTGRIYHWTGTNNVVIAEIWSRIDSLDEPQQPIFRSFLVSAGVVVEELIGPRNKSKKVGFHCNLKELSLEQFRDLYDVLLTYFVVFDSKSQAASEKMLRNIQEIEARGGSVNHNPEKWRKLKEPLKKVVSNQVLSEELIMSMGVMGELDAAQLGGHAWDRIVSILGCGDSLAAGQLIYFGTMAGRAYLEAVKDV